MMSNGQATFLSVCVLCFCRVSEADGRRTDATRRATARSWKHELAKSHGHFYIRVTRREAREKELGKTEEGRRRLLRRPRERENEARARLREREQRTSSSHKLKFITKLLQQERPLKPWSVIASFTKVRLGLMLQSLGGRGEIGQPPVGLGLFVEDETARREVHLLLPAYVLVQFTPDLFSFLNMFPQPSSLSKLSDSMRWLPT